MARQARRLLEACGPEAEPRETAHLQAQRAACCRELDQQLTGSWEALGKLAIWLWVLAEVRVACTCPAGSALHAAHHTLGDRANGLD